MPDPVVQLWEFANAPAPLRELVPPVYPDGWLAFVCPGCTEDIVEVLMNRRSSRTFPVLRVDTQDGGIVLTGPLFPPADQTRIAAALD